MALLTVEGEFTNEELDSLKGLATVKQIKGEEEKVKIVDNKLSIKTLKKDLLDILSVIESREKQEIKNLKELINNTEKIKDENILEKVKEGKTTFFLIFSNEFNSDQREMLTNIRDREIPYFIFDDKKIAESLNIPFPGVFAYNATESVSYRLPINNFFGIVMTPILSVLTNESMKYIDQSKLITFYIFFKDNEKEIKQEFKNLARNLRSEFKFSLLKFIPGQTDLRHFEIEEKDLPAIIHVNEERNKYRLPKVTKKILEKFIKEFKEGKSKMFLRSEEPPKKQGDLVELVGKTHDEFIKNSKSDILIVYGSERCPHCTNLLPTLHSLAEKQKDNKNLKIAYINLEKNDVKVRIEAFPTIMIYTTGTETPIKYKEYGRTEEDLLRFIKKEGLLNKNIDVPEIIKEEDVEEDTALEQPVVEDVKEDL